MTIRLIVTVVGPPQVRKAYSGTYLLTVPDASPHP